MGTVMLSGKELSAAEHASRIKQDAMVWDMTLPWCTEFNESETLPRIKAAGVNLISVTVALDTDTISSALQNIGRMTRFISANSANYALVKSIDDIKRAKAAGKLAVSLHAQGTSWLESNLDVLQIFYDLGMRHMLLAYQVRNFVADGCGERTDSGLSRYGLRLIGEMNRLGMIVDCSHTGYRSSLEAIEASTAPCIISHSNSRTIYEHYRNVPDELIIACAKGGGVIGVNGMGNFLSETGASPEAMFRHIDYMVDLVGSQSVGLGFDYVANPIALAEWVNKGDGWPENNGRPGNGISTFVQPEQLDQLIEIMLSHHYSDESVKDILGRSFMRVASQVWR